MPEELIIRDLIYFDFDKTASIDSQFGGGLLKETQLGGDKGGEAKTGFNLNFGVVGAEFGGGISEKRSQLETRILHHDLLVRVENALFDKKVAVDLNNSPTEKITKIEQISEVLDTASYIRAEGWTYIQDFSEIRRFANAINDIYDYINKSIMKNIEDTEEYRNALAQIQNLKNDLEKITDRNKKTPAKQQIVNAEKALKDLVKSVSQNEKLPDWMVKGINDFINTFVAEHINLRLFPFEEIRDFQILANLKRNCFVDSNISNLLFAYGSQPNVKLTILGLITSFPDKNGHPFFSLTDDVKSIQQESNQDLEKVFQKIFDALITVENYGRFSHYPNITIYPLAVYRTIRSMKK